jgi:hypothetical protein
VKNTNEIPLDPDKLSLKHHQAAGEHYDCYRNARSFVEKLLKREEDLVSQGIWDTETEALVPYNPEIKTVVGLLGAVRICIEGERQALNLELRVDQVAIAKVQSMGFILQLPDGSVSLD